VDVRRLVSGLEQVLYGTRRGAAVPELGTGTNYSSGTAAVDRLVSETNGAGIPLVAQAIGGGMPMQMPMPAAAQTGGVGMPMPAVAQMPMAAPPQPQIPQPQVLQPQFPQPQIPQPQPQYAPAMSAPSQPQMQAPMPAAAATPPGVPARGGLTAAQVRGTTGPGLAPAPATGWPNAQSWPNAAGMGQTG
jgi:hypothetical protein